MLCILRSCSRTIILIVLHVLDQIDSTNTMRWMNAISPLYLNPTHWLHPPPPLPTPGLMIEEAISLPLKWPLHGLWFCCCSTRSREGRVSRMKVNPRPKCVDWYRHKHGTTQWWWSFSCRSRDRQWSHLSPVHGYTTPSTSYETLIFRCPVHNNNNIILANILLYFSSINSTTLESIYSYYY